MEAEKFMTRDAATYELRKKLQHEIFSEIKRNIDFIYSSQGIDYIRVS